MDLKQKLQEVAGYPENRAQVAVENLSRIESGLGLITPCREATLGELCNFLPKVPKEPKPYVVPIPRKWAPIEKIDNVLDNLRAFEPKQHESIASIRNRYMIAAE